MMSLSTRRLHLRVYEMKDEKAVYEVIKCGTYQDVWHAAILKGDYYTQKGI